MLKAGDKIDLYTLIKPIGRGGFGSVWVAERQTAVGSIPFALKVIPRSHEGLEFIREGLQAWAHVIGHPNILPIVDVRLSEDQFVIATEYVPTGSLADWLREHGDKAPSVEAAVEITMGILAGLSHLHAHGVIHRDIKPSNILLRGLTPMIADFGISVSLKSGEDTSNEAGRLDSDTISRAIVGTPRYMAPEAWMGKSSVQTDIFSVGVILYQMLSGRLPFPAAGNELASLMASGREQPEPLPVEIHHAIQSVVFRALAAHPSKRFASANDMRVALKTAVMQAANSSITKPITRGILMGRDRGNSIINFFVEGLLKSLNKGWVVVIASTIVVVSALLQGWGNVSSPTIYRLLGFVAMECLLILLAYIVLHSLFKKSKKITIFRHKVAHAYLQALENSKLDAHITKGDSYV